MCVLLSVIHFWFTVFSLLVFFLKNSIFESKSFSGKNQKYFSLDYTIICSQLQTSSISSLFSMVCRCCCRCVWALLIRYSGLSCNELHESHGSLLLKVHYNYVLVLILDFLLHIYIYLFSMRYIFRITHYVITSGSDWGRGQARGRPAIGLFFARSPEVFFRIAITRKKEEKYLNNCFNTYAKYLWVCIRHL